MQDELLARVVGWFAGRPVRHILELGCGTGGLTAKLVEQFPEARIVAVDLATGRYVVAGILDDDPASTGKAVLGYPVLGKSTAFRRLWADKILQSLEINRL